MSIDNFSHLEAKIIKALDMITRLKNERTGLMEAKTQLEDHIRHLTEENDNLKTELSENSSILEEYSALNTETEEQFKDKINSAISKIDDMLGSDFI